MRIVIAGYGEMLASLINGVLSSRHELVGVLRYDRVKYSRFTLFFKDIFWTSKDLSYIKSRNIYDIKAQCINSKKFIKEVKKLNADLILIGSWGEKIKEETLQNLPIKWINTHPSLLPQHRGANPYFWVIYNGDEKSGLTFHYVDKGFDSGDILLQMGIRIDKHLNALGLKLKTCKVAELSIAGLLDDIEDKKIIPVKQNEQMATFERQIDFEHLILDLTKTKLEILNHIRAISPYYKPVLKVQDVLLAIKDWNFLEENEFLKEFKAGEIIKKEKNKITVKTSDSVLEVIVI